MPDVFADDPFLGALDTFPTVLHGRASFSFDINPESMQKALISALAALQRDTISRDVTVADQEGYLKGQLNFRLGIGNGDCFDVFDSREEARVLHRIESQGPLHILDLLFQVHYSVGGKKRHRVHEDHYVMRLVFQPGSVEILIHHLKGVRRVEPDELIALIIQELNVELTRERYGKIELEHVAIT